MYHLQNKNAPQGIFELRFFAPSSLFNDPREVFGVFIHLLLFFH